MSNSTISFRAGEIAAADLATKPLGQPSAEPLTGEIMTRAIVFLTTRRSLLAHGSANPVHRVGSLRLVAKLFMFCRVE